MDFAVANFETVRPHAQSDDEPTYYSLRTTEDSRLDPCKTLVEKFNLLRTADSKRYPAFFDWQDHRYQVILKKIPKTDT